MKEKVKELEKNCLMEISYWWGGRLSGSYGKIITSDYVLYEYSLNFGNPYLFEKYNLPKEWLTDGIKLPPSAITKINDFIENKIISKEYESSRILDAGWSIVGNYKKTPFAAINVLDEDKNHYLYDEANTLLTKIKLDLNA